MKPDSEVNFTRGFLHFFFFSFRAFGDKSGPPSLPDVESEGQEVNGQECEVDEEEEVAEEQSPGGEMMADQASSGVEELSLTEQEEEKGEKGNKEEEAEQDDQKMTQGIQHIDSFQQVKETLEHLPAHLDWISI